MTEKVPKKLEDLTLDEIKAQLAIYHNLYQKRRKKEDPVYLEKERERGRQKYYRKKENKPKIRNQNQKLATENTTILMFF